MDHCFQIGALIGAAILSLLVCPVVFLLQEVFINLIAFDFNISSYKLLSDPSMLIGIMAFALFIGFPFALPILIFVVYPLIIFFVSKNILNFYIWMFASFVIGIVFSLLIIFFGEMAEYTQILITGALSCSMMTCAMFWFWEVKAKLESRND